MKTILSSIAFILCAAFASAQHEYDVWYFGSQAGIDFTSGVPVNLTNGQVYTTEGSSSISDSAGNLLFYTDGVSVWNKNHVQMSNGFGLEGGGSTTQSALILRRPSSDSLYYIFTVGEAGSYGVAYSIVDMSLQGGLGQVILKNVSLFVSAVEKQTAVKHANGTDYWVVFHDLGNADFYAYQFGASGVNATPVISTVGKVHNWEIGAMKGSHDGTKLGVGVQYGNFFQLLDFDNATGDVTNPITIICPPTAFGPYGIEFSPNDSILYGTAYSGPCVILQWDISSGDSALINASELAIDSSSAGNIGSLQLASDGKIYMAKYGEQYLGVVNNPNVLGMGCNYVDNGFNLSPKSSQLGLPNIPPHWYSSTPSSSSSSSFAGSDTDICEKFCINFYDSSLNNPTSWQWEFPGGNPSSSTLQNPTNICYNTPGIYNVTLITTNAGGSDTLTLTNYITVYTNPFAPVISQAGNVLTSTPATSYQWQLNSVDIPGATNQSYTITQSGLYTVIIYDDNGCSAQASVDASYVGIAGVDENSLVNVFPNPSSGNFMVEWLNGFAGDEISISIFNALGQEIFSSEEMIAQPQKKEIDVSNIAPGVYFLEINSIHFSVKRKIVIER